MQDEPAEIRLQDEPAAIRLKRLKQFITPYYEEEEGPDDEFRPVKISIVTTTTTTTESRDAEELTNVLTVDEERETIHVEREPEPPATTTTTTEKTEQADETPIGDDDGAETEAIEVRHDSLVEEDVVAQHSKDAEEESRSFVSELSRSKTQESSSSRDDGGEKGLEETFDDDDDDDDQVQSKGVSMFDTSLMEEENQEEGKAVGDADDLSVMSKTVVDESKKNVEEAEALAQEMKRQLAESLAAYSNTTPNPSLEDDDDDDDEPTAEEKESEEMTDDIARELPTASPSVSTPSSTGRSKSRSVGIEKGPSDVGSDHRVELSVVDAATEIGSVSSAASSSSKNTTGSGSARGSRPTFRQRRPSTMSWSRTDDTASADGGPRRLPITQRRELILERVVVPAVFLVVAVAICRTFFHSWLRVGDGYSTAWALTWTVLCVVAVVAPVCALEYLLLGGFLAGTVVQKALAGYPEVRRFLRDVRRMRLKAGWWYPSEVRTLRRDLESTNAEFLSRQSQINERQTRDSEEDLSIRRQMSREEHRKEKAQLERVFDVERSEWSARKDELIAEAAAQVEENARLRDQVRTEQQKQAQIAAQKEQLENNIEVERAQWKFSRLSLEDALKTSIAAQKDHAGTRKFFEKMETAHEEERLLWEKERDGFRSSIRQAEEDAARTVGEHEEKLRLLDEMRAAKQSEWDAERKFLQDAVKEAIDEAKEREDALNSRICKLMDAEDEKYEEEIEKVTEKFIVQKEALEQMLEDTRGEQEVTSRCVQNLQSVLDEERAEWKTERGTLEETARSAWVKHAEAAQKLDQTERVFAEERATWETARRTFEEALESANRSSSDVRSIRAVEEEARRAKKALVDELKSKESKIKALEESVAQFENILAIQERVELSTKASTEKQSNTRSGKKNRRRQRAASANREADGLRPVAYIVPQDEVEVKLQSSMSSSVRSSSRSIELSSSRDSTNAEARSEDSSSYYSWVQRIQETHGREQKQLLKGMLKQHVRWQKANHHVGQLLVSSQAMLEASSFASDDSDGAENFHGSIVRYTTASASAKAYMDELVNRTGHEDLLEVRPVPSLAASSFDSGGSFPGNGYNNVLHNTPSALVDDDEEKEEDGGEQQRSPSPSQRSNRSVAVVANPWLKNAPLWQQVWSSFLMARMSPFRLCKDAVRTVCTGIFGGTLGLLHLRAAATAPKLAASKKRPSLSSSSSLPAPTATAAATATR